MPSFSFPIQPDEERTAIYDLSGCAPIKDGDVLSSVLSSSCTIGGAPATGILVSVAIDTTNTRRIKVRRIAGTEGQTHIITALLETDNGHRIEVDITSVTRAEILATFELQPSEITIRAVELANQAELAYLGETLSGNPAVTVTADDASSTTGMFKSATHEGTQPKIKVGQPNNGRTYTVQSLSTTSGGHVIAANIEMVGKET